MPPISSWIFNSGMYYSNPLEFRSIFIKFVMLTKNVASAALEYPANVNCCCGNFHVNKSINDILDALQITSYLFLYGDTLYI
jgi:hypothetical protein